MNKFEKNLPATMFRISLHQYDEVSRSTQTIHEGSDTNRLYRSFIRDLKGGFYLIFTVDISAHVDLVVITTKKSVIRDFILDYCLPHASGQITTLVASPNYMDLINHAGILRQNLYNYNPN
jgi:hypothetical protein